MDTTNDRRLNLVEIDGEDCCEHCSKDKPTLVKIFHRIVGSTPNVPLYLCVECKRVRWS